MFFSTVSFKLWKIHRKVVFLFYFVFIISLQNNLNGVLPSTFDSIESAKKLLCIPQKYEIRRKVTKTKVENPHLWAPKNVFLARSWFQTEHIQMADIFIGSAELYRVLPNVHHMILMVIYWYREVVMPMPTNYPSRPYVKLGWRDTNKHIEISC